MLNAKNEFPNRIKTICLFCGEEVKRNQISKGKAICWECDKDVFNTKVEKTPTPDEYYKQKKNEEEEMFLKIMKRMFLRKQ